MTCTRELLSQLGPELEERLKPQLAGLFGGVVRSYLPQLWVFRTELDTASLEVDRTGSVSAVDGAKESPDVTIEIGHERLRTALTTRQRELFPKGPLTVTPHTAKGKTAFDVLRQRLHL